MAKKPNKSLTFATLRSRNVERCEKHFHKLTDWTTYDWFMALVGELGEAANLFKKLKRIETDGADAPQNAGLPSRKEMMKAVGHELADVQIYLDLLAASLQVSLASVVTARFVPRTRRSRIATFAGLRAAAVAEFARCNDAASLVWPVSQWLALLTADLGSIATSLRGMQQARTGLVRLSWQGAAENHIAGAQSHLCMFATHVGIDLEAVVIEKFNKTSDKIGSKIKLGTGNAVRR